MHRELVIQGVECSENTVAKLMRENQIQARNKPKFRISTTDSNHDLPIAPNRLNQQFSTSSINQVWLTDFTYIPTKEGFSYLCAFKDLCSRRIVGWAMSRKIDAELAIDALNQAVALREPPRDLIIHSDRGSQFASKAFRKRIDDCYFLQSMSRKGNCYDNAPMESFFATLKKELIHHEDYETREEARQSIFEYIEVFYNRVRRHSALGYKSPEEFERAA